MVAMLRPRLAGIVVVMAMWLLPSRLDAQACGRVDYDTVNSAPASVLQCRIGSVPLLINYFVPNYEAATPVPYMQSIAGTEDGLAFVGFMS